MSPAASSDPPAFAEVVTVRPHEFPPRRPLPKGRNIGERPVWQPPTLDYQNLIGEKYEKKREAILKYFRKDVVKTTAFMDFDTEGEVLQMYVESLLENFDYVMAEGDNESRKFFQALRDEVL